MHDFSANAVIWCPVPPTVSFTVSIQVTGRHFMRDTLVHFLKKAMAGKLRQGAKNKKSTNAFG